MSAPADTVSTTTALPAAPELDETVIPDWARLSPRMLAVHPIQELLRGSPALIALLLLGHGKGSGDLWSLAGLVVVLGLGVLRYLTTTYRITPHHVQVRRGLLRRSVVSAPRDRIRSVDLTRHWLHRILGLARVTVGTGTSDRKGDGGLKLDALSLDQATALREELLHGRARTAAAAPAGGPATPAGASATAAGAVAADRTAEPDPGTGRQVLARLSPSWIRYGPFSLSGVLTVLVILAFGSQFVAAGQVDLGGFGPLKALGNQLNHASTGLAVVEIVALCLVIVALASTARYLLRFWNFQLVRTGQGTLQITHGLIATRATTVEERRIRGVEIAETLPLRLVGAARCIAITTGLQIGRGAERGGSLLLPPAPRSAARSVAGAVLADPRPMTAVLAQHGVRARRRRYTRALGLAAIVTGLLLLCTWLAGWPGWLWQGSLALAPISLLLAADRYRNLGHALLDGRLVSSRGSLVRRRSVLSGDGVIGWKMRRTFFQRRAGLVTLMATTAAGRQGYPVPDIDLAEGIALAEATTPDLLRPFLAEPQE